MPVDLRTHDPDDGVDVAPGTNKARILKLLYTNPNLGYKPSEVRDATKIPSGSATTTLLRLHEAGQVGKTTDGYYHALENRDDLRRFATALVQAESLTSKRPEDGLSPADAEQTKPRKEQLESLESAETASIETELDALADEFE